MPITVAIVEDDALIRKSWAELIEEAPGFRCIGTCGSAEEALRQFPKLAPEVILMDIHLPSMSGIECTSRLKQLMPQARVLILTVYEDNEQIFKALQAGASGYLLKRTTPAELLVAITDVHRGGAPMTSEIARKVVESFRRVVPRHPSAEPLSQREEEILNYLARGYANKEIAERLSISFDTVRSHLKNIYEKLHVHSRTEAVIKYLGSQSRDQDGSQPRP
jgi:DNA-binding NarL/FixJ family response regulator